MRKLLVAAALAVLTAGCGGGTDVSGKVSYQGKPVAFGSVVILGSDGLPKAGVIQPDGSFRVGGVALGPAMVAVSSPPPPGITAPGKGPTRGKDEEDRPRAVETPASPEVIKGWFPLPAKYAEPTTSGLAPTIERNMTLPLDLK